MRVTRAGFAVRARLIPDAFLGRADDRTAGRCFGRLDARLDRACVFFFDAPRFNRFLLLSLQLAAEYQKV
jgi:hypothetical protein